MDISTFVEFYNYAVLSVVGISILNGRFKPLAMKSLHGHTTNGLFVVHIQTLVLYDHSHDEGSESTGLQSRGSSDPV